MSADGAGKCLCKATLNYLGKIMAITRCSWTTEKKQTDQDKQECGNYRPVSLTSIPGKVRKQVIPKYISNHIKENKLIESSQHGFTKGKSYLNNLVAFCKEMTGSAD